jgi:phosphoesterase RecJ-like protein
LLVLIFDMSIHDQIFQAVKQAQKIAITSHISPDGDSIGSSLGLFHFLKALGKDPKICHADVAPAFLTWLDGAEEIISFEKRPELAKEILLEADLVFCLDYNEPSRVGEGLVGELMKSGAIKIMMDHHLHPANFCAITYSDTNASSTSQMVYEFLDGVGCSNLVNQSCAQALYVGIMTDTGSFRYSSVNSRTHEILADLLKTGIAHHLIHEKVFDSNSLERLKLRGYAVAEKMVLHPNYPVAFISLTQDELNRFHYTKGDTDGLVNIPLSVEGIMVSALFVEMKDRIKISFRAKGEYQVNIMASEHFSGGGHRYASGGVSFDTLENTTKLFQSLIPVFFA